MKFRQMLLLASAVGAIGTQPAVAQQSQSTVTSGDSSAIADIVVTARRKNEDAQDVPLTITAVSGEELVKQDIRNATDFVRSVPSVSFCCQRGEVQYPFVRGIPGVKGYFAEVPAVLDGNAYYFDVQSVQVLKGPQGTLFGTATNGGAILNEPNRPGKEFGGYVSGTVGDYARVGFEAVVNAPISESLQMRAGASWNKSRGYIHDESNGRRYGNEDYFIGRVGFNYDAGKGFSNYLVLNYYDSRGDRPPFTPYAVNPAFTATYAALSPIIEEQQQLGLYNLVGTGVEGGNDDRRRMLNIVNQTSLELSDSLRLRNIFGYNRTRFFSRFDADGTSLAIMDSNVLPTVAPGADRQVSEELQLQGKIGERFDFTAGTFNLWFKAGTSGHVALNDLSDSFGILTGSLLHSSKTRTNAVYAEGTYNFGDDHHGLRLTGGIRYTVDHVDLVQTNSVWVRMPELTDLADFGAYGVPHTEYDLHNTFKKVTFKGGLQYVFDDRRMAYFTVSRGYSAGGFNTGNPAGLEAYQPESLTNYEAGLKADWSSGDFRARTNLAFYFGKYDNIQVSTTQANCTDPNNLATCQFAVGTFNAAKADIKGVEAELMLSPVRFLEFGGAASYNDNKYKKYENDPDGPGPQPAQDLRGQPFVYNPKYKVSLYGTVRLPLENRGEISLTANYSWQDKLVTSAVPVPQFYDKQDAYGNLDLHLNWDDMMGQTGLGGSVFVTNVTKNTKTDGGFGAYGSLGLWGLSVAVPRQFGVRLRYDF